MENTGERRQNLRAPFEATAVLRASGRKDSTLAEGPTRDLGLAGLYLCTDVRLPVGTPCEVQLRLIGSTSCLSSWIQGEVIRVADDGLAVAFRRIRMDDLSFFRTYLHYNSGEPETIEREFSACSAVKGYVID